MWTDKSGGFFSFALPVNTQGPVIGQAWHAELVVRWQLISAPFPPAQLVGLPSSTTWGGKSLPSHWEFSQTNPSCPCLLLCVGGRAQYHICHPWTMGRILSVVIAIQKQFPISRTRVSGQYQGIFFLDLWGSPCFTSNSNHLPMIQQRSQDTGEESHDPQSLRCKAIFECTLAIHCDVSYSIVDLFWKCSGWAKSPTSQKKTVEWIRICLTTTLKGETGSE